MFVTISNNFSCIFGFERLNTVVSSFFYYFGIISDRFFVGLCKLFSTVRAPELLAQQWLVTLWTLNVGRSAARCAEGIGCAWATVEGSA